MARSGMLGRMTERGLPIVDGPVACPFVAFEDDRDERATAPDHRHRCYAEVIPASRALAHQEAYCLSSAFPVCPTFQDWARREAARTRDAAPPRGRSGAASAGQPDLPPLTRGRSGDAAAAAYSPDAGLDEGEDEEPVYEDPRPRRNPQRGWASPPPWLRRSGPDEGEAAGGLLDAAEPEPPGHAADAAAAGGAVAEGGLAGSFADRLTSGAGPEAPPRRATPPEEQPAWRAGDSWDDELEPVDEDAGWEAGEPAGREPEAVAAPGPIVPSRHRERINAPAPERDDRPAVGASRGGGDRHREIASPVWERPARLEAYPSLRSRRMPTIELPRILLFAGLLVLAAIALFFLPGLLGVGGGKAGASPTPTVAASAAAVASLEPSFIPAATEQTYVVQSGDTMSKIANKFHVPLQTLIDANKVAHPNPNVLNVGDLLIIPTVTPTALPGASPAASGP